MSAATFRRLPPHRYTNTVHHQNVDASCLQLHHLAVRARRQPHPSRGIPTLHLISNFLRCGEQQHPLLEVCLWSLRLQLYLQGFCPVDKGALFTEIFINQFLDGTAGQFLVGISLGITIYVVMLLFT